jgi:hypothetical protein
MSAPTPAERAFLRSLPVTAMMMRRGGRLAADTRQWRMISTLQARGLIHARPSEEASSVACVVVHVSCTEAGRDAMRVPR